MYKDFNLTGVVRIDYIFDTDTSELYVNEVNTIPGSMSGYLFRECGIDYTDLVDALVEEGKNRRDRDSKYLVTFDSELLSGKYFVSKG